MNSITVYVVTNRENGKRYIGQTRQTLSKRFRGHVSVANGKRWKSAFHMEILEYGVKAFTITPIRVCKTQDEADEYEKYWMDMYDSFHPHGYNIRRGGSHAPIAESSKVKMREHVFSLEHRAKISAKQRGHKSTPKQLAALRYGQAFPKNLVGERNPNVILNAQQVVEIRRLLESRKLSQEKIGQQFGIKQVTVSAIKRRRIWAHI